MKILFDQGVPAPLRRHLAGHSVHTAYEQNWSDLENGKLLNAAEAAGYEVLVTTDRNLKYQQNLSGRRIAILVLLSTAWPRIQARTDAIQAAVDALVPADYVEVPI
jgi:predicted nuclease of predicted toxin-antitoxin system